VVFQVFIRLDGNCYELLTSLQMDLPEKFRNASPYGSVPVGNLQVDRAYPIQHAERTETKYGPAIILTLSQQPLHSINVFLPRRYMAVFTDEHIAQINGGQVFLSLIFKGKCVTSNSFILEVK
jgi:hypothetical protein